MKGAVALNVYCFTEREQNRLLTELLGPFAGQGIAAGRLDHFLYDRFDARGPHVFAVLVASADGACQAAAADLARSLEVFLAALPEAPGPAEAEIAARHEACRGKSLCALDRLPGLAGRNSFGLAPHPENDYPFWLWSGLKREAAFWRAISDQSLWAIGQVAARGGQMAIGAGLRFTASIDAALRRTGQDAEAYWRYHVSTLFPDQAEEIAASPAAAAERFGPLVRGGNRQTFDRVWQLVEQPGKGDPRAALLVDSLAAELAAGLRGHRALREAVHLSLKQLGIDLSFQIPLLVHAWRRCFALPAPDLVP